MVSLLIVLAILVAIALGYRTKINIGIFAIVFAFLLGCFVLDLKPADIIRMWPISVFFVIFSVSLFYNFALVNGTLEKLSMNILYLCKKIPFLMPFIIYFAAAFIAALGAGFFSVMAFSAPIALLLCDKVKTSKVVGAVAANCGALSGANFMTSGSGVIFRGLMDNAGFNQESFGYSTTIFAASVIFSLLFIAVFMFLNRRGGEKIGHIEMDKPVPFEPVQKTTIALMGVMIFLVLFPPIAHIIAPANKFITQINSKVDVGLVAIVMSAVALLLKLAPQKQVIAKVPWETLIMICGVGMLIAVAIRAGTIDLLAGWLSSKIPVMFVPVTFALIGACMSFFSSTLGVVCPTLFPLVPAVASATGISPMMLFACIVIGAQSSAISPFSSGGSLILGSCANEEDRSALFPKLIFVAVPLSVAFAMLFSFVISLF
jgi:di/tricarboxylate transporter